jgi:hypothetical protein
VQAGFRLPRARWQVADSDLSGRESAYLVEV